MTSVSTVNVNGIRAAAAKGLAGWLARTGADVVCLQGTRAQHEEIPDGLLGGWHLNYAPCGTSKGRNAERWSDHAPVTVVHT